MIGKSKSNRSLAATIDYNIKEKALLVFQHNLEGLNMQDFRLQMSDLQKSYRGYGKQLTIHTILSPAIEDGKNLSRQQWRKMANTYLQKMQLHHHQAIGFIHSDKNHKHLHLVINKVNNTTLKLYHDSFIGKKTQVVADQIAQEMNLVRAKVIMQGRSTDKIRAIEAGEIKSEVVETKIIGAKQQIEALLDAAIITQPKTAAAYFLTLEKMGCKIHKYFSKETAELRGYGVEIKGTKMDASAVGKKYTLISLGLAGVNKIESNSEIGKEINNKNTDSNLLKPLRDKKKIINLEQYAQSQGIKKEMLHYDVIKMVELGNQYFLAIQNDSKGFTMYNAFTKNHLGDNDITTIIKDKKYPIVIVEDLFTYLTLKQEKSTTHFNFIILNSLANTDKALAKLKVNNFPKILLQLSNDIIGNTVATEIESQLSLMNKPSAKNSRLIEVEENDLPSENSRVPLKERGDIVPIQTDDDSVKGAKGMSF